MTGEAAPANKCLVASAIANQGCFHGFSWDIVDRQVLVRLVAEVLIAHHDHVLSVLHGAAEESPPSKATVIRSVLDKLLAAVRNDQDRYHRDGLLFQHISWIAAASKCMDGDYLSVPHSRKTDKGQDMLIVHLRDHECSVTIGEDKATENARDMVRDQVFPEFKEYEKGNRDNELESETLGILQRHLGPEESSKVIAGILWEKARKYRVAVTTNGVGPEAEDPCDLFVGYDEAVSGDDVRRRAETLAIPAVRDWFDSFAEDVRNLLLWMLEKTHV